LCCCDCAYRRDGLLRWIWCATPHRYCHDLEVDRLYRNGRRPGGHRIPFFLEHHYFTFTFVYNKILFPLHFLPFFKVSQFPSSTNVKKVYSFFKGYINWKKFLSKAEDRNFFFVTHRDDAIHSTYYKQKIIMIFSYILLNN
jgi:hypothetical protein